MATAYQKFLEAKAPIAIERGYSGPLILNPNLKPHARDIAQWAIRGGNRAIFSSFGMAKTSIQLQICESLLAVHRDAAGLITCPLGVRREFIKERKLRGFQLEPVYVATDEDYRKARAEGYRLFLSNYERVRDRQLDPNQFEVCSLDESAVLRSFGSQTYQTFLPLFEKVPYKFVATATPSPNRFKELLHYGAFLGIMDSGQGLTRWFKRDPSQAGNLTLHEHKKQEFYCWLSTWAVFAQLPSDLGHDDTGYVIPAMKVIRHRLPVDHASAGYDSRGQGKLLRNAATGVSDAAREKRDSLPARIARCKQIIESAGPDRYWLIWHDLEDERRAIEREIPGAVCITGTGQEIEAREQVVERFADGDLRILGTKPILSGSGSNFQKFCFSNIFLGIGHKFHDWIQACHRTQRFGQTHEVETHLIYTESEDPIYESLMVKWTNHVELQGRMSRMIKEYGLNNVKAGVEMRRSIGIERKEEHGLAPLAGGGMWTSVNNDCVLETQKLPDASVDLVLTSIPFGNHYEYSESYNDLGHSDNDAHFFKQMDFLTPNLHRTLKPGRLACIHVKDRVVYGSVSGLGMYSVNRFSDKTADHFEKHGFIFCGRITVVTDVVRENNQTYRLGWTENSKDGTKMGVGSPEYILLFRKLPSDLSKAYADEPVVKSKETYTRARWQFDAHGFWRSNGNRFLTPEEIGSMPMDELRKAWHRYCDSKVYDFGEHVKIAEEMERRGILPSSFMALDPTNPHSQWVWDDIARMRTLNTAQGRKGWEQHVCPLQLDIIERLIERYSQPGELCLDPFGGLGSVAYSAILMGRRAYSIELSESYWKDSVSYCKGAEMKISMPTLFDMDRQKPE
jgi:DNA modification methylase